MKILLLSERIIQTNDWATILFFIALIIVAINRNVFYSRFLEFIKLGYSEKYNKIYKDTNNLLSSFTISMFFIQLISYSFFGLILLSKFKITSQSNYLVYIQIITFICVFTLSKILIEKIVAATSNLDQIVDQFNLIKINYRSFLGLILLPVTIVLYYNSLISTIFILKIVIGIIVFYSVYNYFLLIKNHQNLILSKLFYFILYLCTLEIAPYYFIYYWITKK